MLKNKKFPAKLTNPNRFVVGYLQVVVIFETMKRSLLYLAFILLLTPAIVKAQFESVRDSVVQLYGVVMTADSLVGIPAVSVMVKGQNRGTITNSQGCFQ